MPAHHLPRLMRREGCRGRWAAFVAGYRAIGYDYEQAGFSYDVTTFGPVAGFELNFS